MLEEESVNVKSLDTGITSASALGLPSIGSGSKAIVDSVSNSGSINSPQSVSSTSANSKGGVSGQIVAHSSPNALRNSSSKLAVHTNNATEGVKFDALLFGAPSDIQVYAA